MATINLGRIKPVFRGAYDGATAYVVDDIVTVGAAGVVEAFICILASTGNATSDTTYWTKLAAKGTDGTDVGATLTTQAPPYRQFQRYPSMSMVDPSGKPRSNPLKKGRPLEMLPVLES